MKTRAELNQQATSISIPISIAVSIHRILLSGRKPGDRDQAAGGEDCRGEEGSGEGGN